jgi:hemerythrin-like domain-containing protein
MTATPTTPPTGCDTREMVMIHTFIRREFRLAAGVLRRVEARDTARARVVADHLDFIGRFLHHHHTVEDELLWPKLLDRLPDELAPIVHLMESQHEAVDALLGRMGELLPQWRASASPELRDQLSDCYEELYVGLVEHLDAEEQRLLPLAARCISEEEWAELGDTGRRRGRKSDMALVLGMFAYEGDPEVVQGLLAKAPLPVRVLVPRLARRTFRRHALTVHGTATP